MKPTRPGVLVVTGIIAAVVAGFVLRAVYDRLAQLPVGWVVSVLLVAVAEAALAQSTRSRLAGRGARPPDPLAVARFAALARASSPVGAGVAGAWVGVLVFLGTQRGALAAVSHDRKVAVAGLLTGLALTSAALWLEWVCRVHHPPGETDPESGI